MNSSSPVIREPIQDQSIGYRTKLASTSRNSSLESDAPRHSGGIVPRKAYMDLRDAIALLDETCPNQMPSPSLTPRTPLTPHPLNKRARSKSSDNSSNYSNDRFSDKSFETHKSQDKESGLKKRPFLRKIGISKTEDKPMLFAKFAPKITGKPYLKKIGPSEAFERPFLEKIGSSRTIDKFIFSSTPRNERKNASVESEQVAKNHTESPKIKKKLSVPEPEKKIVSPIRKSDMMKKNISSAERRRSGKNFLLKMYSFETEDLEDTSVRSKEHREKNEIKDSIRVASLENVLSHGLGSLPPLDSAEDESMLEERTSSVAELVKCRVTTSEEIICSLTSAESTTEVGTWSAQRRKSVKSSEAKETKSVEGPVKIERDGNVPNSPTKRRISKVSPEPEINETSVRFNDRELAYSPSKTRRQTSEDTLDRSKQTNGEAGKGDRKEKRTQLERWGISSDNLLARNSGLPFESSSKSHATSLQKTNETSSEDSLAILRKSSREYTKEAFRRLQDKFELRDPPVETYAAFKLRTKGIVRSAIDRQQLFMKKSEPNITRIDINDIISKDTVTSETKSRNEGVVEPVIARIDQSQFVTLRSVLRKQDGVDQLSDQETENAISRRPSRKLVHEPSQETMDLLTELRKVKSMLRTPSMERDEEPDKKPQRPPKRVLLTDKEFCLSIERENSVRRSSRATINEKRERMFGQASNTESEPEQGHSPGPALFEKRCLSLDYADEEKPAKPEIKAISLASAVNVQTRDDDDNNGSDSALVCDSKSYSSEVFNTPTDEMDPSSQELETRKEADQELWPSVDNRKKESSPYRESDFEGRTGDFYEIISPRSTPLFRAKKHLGKISVEDTVKPESFTLGSSDKIDCATMATTKRSKCFPL